jgi:hypothetical protein
MDGWTDRRTDRQTDRQKDGWMDGWMDGWRGVVKPGSRDSLAQSKKFIFECSLDSVLGRNAETIQTIFH